MPLHKLWHERYVLVEAMLPCFVSAALGEQVLLVGKAINFIRLSCADSQWSLLTQKGADKPAAEAVGRATAVAVLRVRRRTAVSRVGPILLLKKCLTPYTLFFMYNATMQRRGPQGAPC